MEEDEKILELEKKIAELESDLAEIRKLRSSERIEQPEISATVQEAQPIADQQATVEPVIVAQPFVAQAAPVEPVATEPIVQEQTPVEPAEVEHPEIPKRVYPNYYDIPASPKKEENVSIESFIGKNGMAIGASFLIFIAMIMFAFLIVPNLGDTIKMIAMFVFSFALIAAGELHAMKKGVNPWNTSLTGCGTGAVFVSLFVAYCHFEVLNLISMYICFVIWAACLCFLGNKKSIVFKIIGQCGVVISSIFSADQLDGADSFVIVVAMLILAESSYLITDFIKKNYWGSFASWLGITLSFTLVTASYYNNDDFIHNVAEAFDVIMVIVIFAIVMYTSLVQILFVDNETKNLAYLIQSVVTIWPMGIVILYSLDAYIGDIYFQDIANMIFIVAGITQYYVVDKYAKKSESHAFNYVAQGLFALLIVVANVNLMTSEQMGIVFIGGVFAIVIQALAYLYARINKNIVARFLGLAAILICFIADCEYDQIEYVFTLLMFLIIVAERIIQKAEDRNTAYDNILYLVGMSMIANLIMDSDFVFDFDFDCKIEFICVVLAVFQVVAYIKKFGEIKTADDKSMNPMFLGVNGVVCVLLYVSVILNVDEFTEILYCALLVLLCSLNVKEFLEKYSWAGAYVAAKYTFLLAAILGAHSAYGIMFSGAFLCIAIVSIVLGFLKNYKSMRLYGLVLSIISVIKLVLVDISYNELLYRACGFLVCGILCFAISYIYNKLDRKDVLNS